MAAVIVNARARSSAMGVVPSSVPWTIPTICSKPSAKRALTGLPDMAFFGNDAVNRVNIHYAIQSLAQGAGGTLVFAFLLHAGVSIPMTFVWFAGMLAGR